MEGPGKYDEERHRWKLGEGVWVDITIKGALTPRAFEKLKKYVELLDVSDDVMEKPRR